MASEQNRQIRIRDIARRANVSSGTVDRVLHNRGEVSEHTRSRVLQIIEELKYQPNILASALASKRQPFFVSLLPEPLSVQGYWTRPARGLQKKIDELKYYGFVTRQLTFSQFNAADFREKAARVVSLRPDGVVLAPFFHRETLELAGELRRNKIPFVFIDSDIPGQGQLAFVGQNSNQCGRLSARLLAGIAPSGFLLILHFGKETDKQTHLLQRERGFCDWFGEHRPGRTIMTCDVRLPESQVADDLLNAILQKELPAGIYVTNSKVHLVAAFLHKRLQGHIPLIGHDLLRENVRFLKSGVVDFLIYQHPEEQGYHALDLLVRSVVQKSEVKLLNYTPTDIMVPENVDYYTEFN